MNNTNTNNNTKPAEGKLTSHTDARGNVWYTITRGDETLIETRDEDAASQMAADLGIMSCDER